MGLGRVAPSPATFTTTRTLEERSCPVRRTRRLHTPPNSGDLVKAIKYPAKRKNIPPAGLEAQGIVQEAPKIRYEYNPHLPPVLRSATDAAEADKLPELLAIARQAGAVGGRGEGAGRGAAPA